MSSDGGLAAETELVRLLSHEIEAVNQSGRDALLINLGAGRQAVIETKLADAGGAFRVERVDIELTDVSHPNVGRQWEESITRLTGAEDRHYDMAFANYVFEHVDDPQSAIREIARILRPGGLAVLTLPNPRSPEFIVAAHTPQWFHKRFKPDGYGTSYAYRSIADFCRSLELAGFRLERHLCHPVVGVYAQRLPGPARWIGVRYDDAVVRLALVPLCGAVALATRKAQVPEGSR